MNTNLCKQRLSFTFYTNNLKWSSVHWIGNCRYKKYPQSWKSDLKKSVGSNYTKLCKQGLSLLFSPLLTLQLETLGAYEIVMFRSTSLKLDFLNRILYVDFQNGLNLESPFTNESETLIPRFLIHPVYILHILYII